MSAGTQPALRRVTSRQPRDRAIRSSGGKNCMASESPNSSTVVVERRSPYTQRLVARLC